METITHKKVTREFYSAVHYWLKSKHGKANTCENKKCLGRSMKFEWANIKDKPYDFNRDNFIQLCKSCHALYDLTEEGRIKMSKMNPRTGIKQCHRGHEFTPENTIHDIRKTLAGVNSTHRTCKRCKLDKQNLKDRKLSKVCKKGHLLTEKNIRLTTFITRFGKVQPRRLCLICLENMKISVSATIRSLKK